MNWERVEIAYWAAVGILGFAPTKRREKPVEEGFVQRRGQDPVEILAGSF